MINLNRIVNWLIIQNHLPLVVVCKYISIYTQRSMAQYTLPSVQTYDLESMVAVSLCVFGSSTHIHLLLHSPHICVSLAFCWGAVNVTVLKTDERWAWNCFENHVVPTKTDTAMLFIINKIKTVPDDDGILYMMAVIVGPTDDIYKWKLLQNTNIQIIYIYIYILQLHNQLYSNASHELYGPQMKWYIFHRPTNMWVMEITRQLPIWNR